MGALGRVYNNFLLQSEVGLTHSRGVVSCEKKRIQQKYDEIKIFAFFLSVYQR